MSGSKLNDKLSNVDVTDKLIANMPSSCVAFGCKSGYHTQKQSDREQGITFHSFPLHDSVLCDAWVRSVHRKDFQPSKHSKLCSLHFTESDYIQNRSDSNTARRRKKESVSIKPLRRYLKPSAIPTILPNAPHYLTNAKNEPRSTNKSTASQRAAEAQSRLDALCENFAVSDDISTSSLDTILQKLKSESVPGGFYFQIVDARLLVFTLTCEDSIVTVSACIIVNDSKEISVNLHGKKVAADKFNDICSRKSILSTFSELLNVMARVKCMAEEKVTTASEEINSAVESLRTSLNLLADDTCLLSSKTQVYQKVKYATEQLELCMKPPNCRHYSPSLMVWSYLLFSQSSSTYKQLRNEASLSLPSPVTLRKITRRMNDTHGLDNTAYLRLRISSLNWFEKHVVLIMDEIYVAKRIEYSSGEIVGLTSDGKPASTLLCFMVKSLAGKYQDLVAIFPVATLTAEKQFDCYRLVRQQMIEVGFRVVAISVDNAAVNRKFYTNYLCSGTLRTCIHDETGLPIFLLFDPVHNIKNVYNNFCSKKVFECPSNEEFLPNGCVARFEHIVELYNTEQSKSLKKANLLSASVIDPKSIEKTSVSLAAAVFSESTCGALQFYSDHEGEEAWKETAAFLTMIMKIWHIMNVKSSMKGRRKRNPDMEPVTSSQDWKIGVLNRFSSYLSEWEMSRRPGLTRETFLSFRHTCQALAECCVHLIDHCKFKFVLLGHLQSDPIEARFGWLRQLSGANYFISMKQVTLLS